MHHPACVFFLPASLRFHESAASCGYFVSRDFAGPWLCTVVASLLNAFFCWGGGLRELRKVLEKKEREKDEKKKQEQLEKTQARIAAARLGVDEPVFTAKKPPAQTSPDKASKNREKKQRERAEREERERLQREHRDAEREVKTPFVLYASFDLSGCVHFIGVQRESRMFSGA